MWYKVEPNLILLSMLVLLSVELPSRKCLEFNNNIDYSDSEGAASRKTGTRVSNPDTEDGDLYDLDVSESDKPVSVPIVRYADNKNNMVGMKTQKKQLAGNVVGKKRNAHEYPLGKVEYGFENAEVYGPPVQPIYRPVPVPVVPTPVYHAPPIDPHALQHALASNPLLAALYLASTLGLHPQQPIGLNSASHLPVNPYVALLLSHYGRYLHLPFRNTRGIYGYAAANNIHNNMPFGSYKIYEEE